MLIIWDAAHGTDVSGKRMKLSNELYSKYKTSVFVDSNGYFREYIYSREVIRYVREKLDLDPEFPYITQTTVLNEKEIGLSARVQKMEMIKNTVKSDRYLVISPHNNAMGYGESFDKAKGFSIWTTVGQTKSDEYAEKLFNILKADFPELKALRQTSDGDSDYEQNFKVLTSSMPSILIEFLFYTNEEDLEFLLNYNNLKRYGDSLIKFCKEIIK